MRTRGWQQKCETLELPCQRYQEQSEGQMVSQMYVYTSLHTNISSIYVSSAELLLYALDEIQTKRSHIERHSDRSVQIIAFASSLSHFLVIVIRKAGSRRSWSSKQRPHCSVSYHLSPHRNNVDQQFDNLTGRPKKVVKLTNNSAGLDRQLLPAL